jgi:hypothetical protein
MAPAATQTCRVGCVLVVDVQGLPADEEPHGVGHARVQLHAAHVQIFVDECKPREVVLELDSVRACGAHPVGGPSHLWIPGLERKRSLVIGEPQRRPSRGGVKRAAGRQHRRIVGRERLRTRERLGAFLEAVQFGEHLAGPDQRRDVLRLGGQDRAVHVQGALGVAHACVQAGDPQPRLDVRGILSRKRLKALQCLDVRAGCGEPLRFGTPVRVLRGRGEGEAQDGDGQ